MQAMQDDTIRTARIYPAFILVTAGWSAHMAKFPASSTEILVGKTEISEPSKSPLIWTHQKFYKGFRSSEISETGKPGQPDCNTGAVGLSK